MNLEDYLKEKSFKKKKEIKKDRLKNYKLIWTFPLLDGRKVELLKLVDDVKWKIIFNLKL